MPEWVKDLIDKVRRVGLEKVILLSNGKWLQKERVWGINSVKLKGRKSGLSS